MWRFWLYVLAVLAFLIFAIVAATGGSWDTPTHLDVILGVGLALFTAAHIPAPPA
jgi:hypothetical protein